MDGKIESRWIGALALIGVPHILTIRAGGKGGGWGNSGVSHLTE